MYLLRKALNMNIMLRKVKPADVIILDNGFSNLKLESKIHHYKKNNYYLIQLLKRFLILLSVFLQEKFRKFISKI